MPNHLALALAQHDLDHLENDPEATPADYSAAVARVVMLQKMQNSTVVDGIDRPAVALGN